MAVLVLGVDPGLDGALAFYDGETLTVHDMPAVAARARGRELDCAELARIVDAAGHIAHAVVEQAWPRPDEAASRAAKQGANWGVIRGIIAAHFIPCTIVSPQRWTRALGVQKGKDASRARASELLPAYSHLWQRKRDDGRAEAALLALYGWRSLRPAEVA